MRHRHDIITAIACLVLLAQFGCGDGDSSATQSTGNQIDGKLDGAGGDSQQSALPTASISPVSQSSQAAKTQLGVIKTASLQREQLDMDDLDNGTSSLANEEVKIEKLKADSAEWKVREITRLRVQALPKTEDVDDLKKFRAERNKKIIQLAMEAVKQTHADKEKQLLFTVGVRHLLDAHLQLALQGDQESIDALYDHSESLFKRDPLSQAAADAGYTVAKFANTSAQQYAMQEPRWIEEFVKQSRLFASRFPKETIRAPQLLQAAAQTCQLYGLNKQALACCLDLEVKYPNSSETEQVAGLTRRLRLKGQPLQLAGETIEGGFVSIDDYKGSVVLVVFWATTAKPFIEQLPEIQSLSKKYRKYGFEIVGVNLDEDEPAIDAFQEKTSLDWRQIFYSARDKRGWNNPAAVYYGVRTVPTLMLVDHSGVTELVTSDAKKLEEPLRALLRKKTAANAK
ncbi:MAG: TlpA family protein disulfide reductase [Planctomycetes bacterium]|nr:TlpA family protein disulfide reductase [Planctomycetota bacterium]MCH9726510.1 TlpA family protein disulfide reductase [Planctomycetota bacterium]MCH9778319.1 TlpA family protein disulfide reductase [Planctomycetota bacterium]MCH9792413.1 TlpA family protein disulfide reductase [Planctomycetota bacterium]